MTAGGGLTVRRLRDTGLNSRRAHASSGIPSEVAMTQPGTGKYERLLERCRGLAPIPTAVAYPCEETALAGAIDAGAQGLIVPILVGPAATMAEIAKAKGIVLGDVQ